MHNDDFNLLKPPPLPSSSLSGARGAFSSITGMQFSPTRPGVFAAGSAEGLLYLYDMTSPISTPIVALEAPTAEEDPSQAQKQGLQARRASAINHRRSGLTGIAFNRKQRDLIAACDSSGRIHIWKLSWSLSHSTHPEFEFVKALNNNIVAEEEALK
jgi:WD40 repeat protein